ncbi:MAG: glycosyltransferase family 4 protein [Candidatus Altiarchaeota archaeon]|nr:glycosyltransferase family 4 protein [Candidatus Altiarchaeota archaeon]
MRILMFGWEFPPFNTGGLGTACYGLTKGLSRQGADLTLVLPHVGEGVDYDYLKVLYAKTKGRIKIRGVDSILKPYVTSESYAGELAQAGAKGRYAGSRGPWAGAGHGGRGLYGADLFNEVYRYSREAGRIAEEEDFDVIHCHDWLTYSAGIEARKAAEEKGVKAPLIAHVHATEFDRTGGNPNGYVYHLEREGMHKASYVIAVSNYTKNMIVNNYGLNPEKVHVVHNSIDFEPSLVPPGERQGIRKHYKTVLFLGRMTIQKGPDHFLRIAQRVLEVDPEVRFIMAGSGDMFRHIVEESARLGIGDRVLYTDHLSGSQTDEAYRMADVYVMSSISEPFGLTVLEAMKNGTPVVVCKQSGVSEVVRNCLVADFWDRDEMANKILAVLNNPELRETLSMEGLSEISGFSWDAPARKCMAVYEKAVSEAKW